MELLDTITSKGKVAVMRWTKVVFLQHDGGVNLCLRVVLKREIDCCGLVITDFTFKTIVKYRLSTFVLLILICGVVVGFVGRFAIRNSLRNQWRNVTSDGIDTMVGHFESKHYPHQIKYDVGPFAGQWAAFSTYRKTKWIKSGSVDGSDFVYMLDEDSVLYVTFPDEGPANFWTTIRNEKDVGYILELLSAHRNELLEVR